MTAPVDTGKRRLGLIAGAVAVVLGLTAMSSAPPDTFEEPAFVSLRESNQVAKFPGPAIWEGGKKMLYNSLTPDGEVLVVSSPAEASVYAFDAASGKQLAVVKVGKASKGLKISPDGKEVYVSNEGEASVSVVDLASYKEVAKISTDEMPHNVRFTSDGKTAYVTLQGGAGLGVIDTAQRKVVKVIPLPGLEGPHNLDLSKDEKQAYVRDTANHVAVLDLDSGEVKKIVETGQGHAGIDVIPNGKLAFTGAIADDVVTVIDTKDLSVVKKIKVGFGPHGVRASKDSRWLYVAVTSEDKVVVIDTESLEVVEEHTDVGSFPFWVAVNGNP